MQSTRQISTENLSLTDLFHRFSREFYHVEGLASELRFIMCSALGVSSGYFFSHADEVPEKQAVNKVYKVLQKRSVGVPLAYILGQQNFYGLDFIVNPSVLIPRQESELLVEHSVAFMGSRPMRVLDVGTGSGCLAITIKKHCASAQVQAWDISESALDVARQNAEQHSVQVEFMKRDVLRKDSWVKESEAYDLIVANPPYICKSETESLSAGVLQHEPHVALFAGREGLEYYYFLAEHAGQSLKPGGQLLCEIGYQQGAQVEGIFNDYGWTVELKKDYAKHDRIIVAKKQYLGKACAPS